MKLDGNAIGGLMLELFGREMTAASGICRSCGAEDVLARVEVYVQAAGTVARCRQCEAVLMRVVEAPGRTWVDLSGFRTIELRTD
jgi:hypothetical protein